MLQGLRRCFLKTPKTLSDWSVKHYCVSKTIDVKSDTIDPEIPISHEVHSIIKWRKPVIPSLSDPRRTCDLEALPPIDPSWYNLKYQPFAEQLDKLPEDQRKLFTVDFCERREAISVIKEQFVSKVRRHKWDGVAMVSKETKIAWLTVHIRDLRERILETKQQEFRSTRGFTLRIKKATVHRKKLLNDLRKIDYKRFEWLIEALAIMYRPDGPWESIHRRKCVDRLTDMYCENIKTERMKAYKEELEAQKVPFLEEKLAILQEIRGDEESMGLSPSVTREIEETIKRIETLKRTHLELQPVNESVIDDDGVALP